MYNYTTIIGDNFRCFINKNMIYIEIPINILYNKIDLYSTQHTLIDDIWVASSIRELCESRDSEYTNLFDLNESRKLIDFLCPTYTKFMLCIVYVFTGVVSQCYVASCYFPTHCMYMYYIFIFLDHYVWNYLWIR